MGARNEKYGFVEGEDFTVHKFMNSGSRGQATIDYYLTIETAKELAFGLSSFTLLSRVSTFSV